MTSKVLCMTCMKAAGQFKCEGCSQAFCLKHVGEHRQALNQQLDEIIVEHDIFQQTMRQDQYRSEQWMFTIEKWENESMEKIRQTAQKIREEVHQLTERFQKTVVEPLEWFKSYIKKAREDDDFFENDLRNWLTQIEQLKNIKTETLSNVVTEDLTAVLVHSIRLECPTSTLIEKLPSRLQYTHQDGVYVNPHSFLVTLIWYFYSPQRNGWFWTPYKTFEIWMPVETLIVKSGFFKNQKPTTINVKIIKFLQENNPRPTEEIIREAFKAEDRILIL